METSIYFNGINGTNQCLITNDVGIMMYKTHHLSPMTTYRTSSRLFPIRWKFRFDNVPFNTLSTFIRISETNKIINKLYFELMYSLVRCVKTHIRVRLQKIFGEHYLRSKFTAFWWHKSSILILQLCKIFKLLISLIIAF